MDEVKASGEEHRISNAWSAFNVFLRRKHPEFEVPQKASAFVR